WPYLYLPRKTIPVVFYLLAVLTVLLSFVTKREAELSLNLQTLGREGWHFFFLGAAFLLLEVSSITRSAAAIANTWTVNAVMISAMMILSLAGTMLVRASPRLPVWPVYVLLAGSCLLLYNFDPADVATFSPEIRAI